MGIHRADEPASRQLRGAARLAGSWLGDRLVAARNGRWRIEAVSARKVDSCKEQQATSHDRQLRPTLRAGAVKGLRGWPREESASNGGGFESAHGVVRASPPSEAAAAGRVAGSARSASAGQPAPRLRRPTSGEQPTYLGLAGGSGSRLLCQELKHRLRGEW